VASSDGLLVSSPWLAYVAVGPVVVVGVVREGLQARCVGSCELLLGTLRGDLTRSQLAHVAFPFAGPTSSRTAVTTGLSALPCLVGQPAAFCERVVPIVVVYHRSVPF